MEDKTEILNNIEVVDNIIIEVLKDTCGSSVIRRWNPQLFAKLENMMAQNGTDVQICFHGIGGDTELVAGRPASIYSLSSCVIVGCVAGVSAASNIQSTSQTKHAPPSI